MERLTANQIIDETVDYYTNNPRALEPNCSYCSYVTEDGRLCAHSRCLTDEGRSKAKNSDAAHHLIMDKGDDIHQEQYRGQEPNFWKDIQNLHDENPYWRVTETGNELTLLGELIVKQLKNTYK